MNKNKTTIRHNVKRVFATGVTLCFLLSCSGPTPQKYLDEAARFEEKGQWKTAIESLNKAIGIDPRYVPAYINRGADRSAMGDYAGAIRDDSIALQWSPNNIRARVNRGRNENNVGRYQNALQDLQTAIRKKQTHVYIDRPLQQKGDEWDDYDSPMAEIRLERGFAYYNLDSLQLAFQDVQSCIDNQFAMPVAVRLRGSIYIATKDTTRGCRDLQQAAGLGDAEAIEAVKKYCR